MCICQCSASHTHKQIDWLQGEIVVGEQVTGTDRWHLLPPSLDPVNEHETRTRKAFQVKGRKTSKLALDLEQWVKFGFEKALRRLDILFIFNFGDSHH